MQKQSRCLHPAGAGHGNASNPDSQAVEINGDHRKIAGAMVSHHKFQYSSHVFPFNLGVHCHIAAHSQAAFDMLSVGQMLSRGLIAGFEKIAFGNLQHWCGKQQTQQKVYCQEMSTSTPLSARSDCCVVILCSSPPITNHGVDLDGAGPGIAARYVRTDPQTAAETMGVFTSLQSFPCKPGF